MITLDELIELSIPKLDEKRTQAVQVELQNGVFQLTEVNNKFEHQFFKNKNDVPVLYNTCIISGFSTTEAVL